MVPGDRVVRNNHTVAFEPTNCDFLVFGNSDEGFLLEAILWVLNGKAEVSLFGFDEGEEGVGLVPDSNNFGVRVLADFAEELFRVEHLAFPLSMKFGELLD